MEPINFVDIFCGLVTAIIFLYFLLKNDTALIFFTLFISIIQGFLIEELYLPRIIKYIPDFLCILIFIKCLYKYFYLKQNMKHTSIGKIIILLFFVQLISFFFNDYNILKYLWAVKNWYRYFMILWGTYYLDIKVNEKILGRILKCILAAQIITIIYEFKTPYKIIMDNPNDRISGLFGNRGTGIALILLIMLFCFVLSRYVHGKDKTIKNVLMILFIMFFQFSLGEVKAGFILTPAIFIIMFFLMCFINKSKERHWWKFIKILCIMMTFLITGFTVYTSIYGKFSHISDLYDKEYLENTLYRGSYNSDGKMINRLNGPQTVKRVILNKPSKFLFGVGLGNAAPINNKMLMGQYYKKYGYLNYNFFFIPYYLIENGYVGTLVLISIIITLLYKSIKAYSRKQEDCWIILGYEGSIFSILFAMIYNSAFVEIQVGAVFWALSGIVLKIIEGEKMKK